MGKVRISEWLWRFLAAVMLFAVGWILWIFYQINPPSIVTNAAFEAAAHAKAKGQSTQGVIVPAGSPAPGPAALPAPPAEPPAAKEAPVNADKLKFSESLATPEKK